MFCIFLYIILLQGRNMMSVVELKESTTWWVKGLTEKSLFVWQKLFF